MIRILIFLIAVSLLAAGLHWLADRPGTVVVEWQDYVAETSVFLAIVLLVLLVALLLLLGWLLTQVFASPAALGGLVRRRRLQRGLDAISGGIIAIGAGDGSLATRYALKARQSLPNAPLTHLLRAQAAQLNGDRGTARRIFEAMLASPDTAQLGLRGLFLEAKREGETEAARQFAERALKLNATLAWPVEALFDLMCKAQDWEGALATLALAQRQHLIDKPVAQRRRAVLLTAKAQEAEDGQPERALELALAAHKLAPELVPAAAIAGRVLASQGNTPRAARVLLRTWRLAPHPELATVYAYARPGDSPRDRLTRVRHLGRLTPQANEALIAIAVAAIEAHEWEEARNALKPLLGPRLTQRVCTLMARIEGEQHANAGAVREWLARALNAPRDPAWTADGIVSEAWAPTSPATGVLDAFRWRVPVEPIEADGGALLAAKVEALVGLGAGSPTQLTQAAPAGPSAADVRALEPPDSHAPAMLAQPSPGSSQGASRENQGAAPPPAAGAQAPSRAAAFDPGGRRPGANSGRTAPAEPRIFVPPRAPDDPGPGAAEDEALLMGDPRGSAAKL
jgi:HemY protein